MKLLSDLNRQGIGRQGFYWVSAFLLLVTLPHFPSLPFWVSGLALVAACARLPAIRQSKGLQKVVTVLVLGALAAILVLVFDSWFSGDAIRAFFIVVLVLKWSEAKNRRDYLGLVFALCILAGLGVLYQATLWGVLYLFVVVFAFLLVLLSLHQTSSDSHAAWRNASRLFLPALPIMALLFLIFPRMNGPLWDMGIAFGLPLSVMLDQNKDERGIEKTLKPGQIKRIKESDDTVLVAEFLGKVPYISRLYWRGPVYWDFNGEQWTIAKGWNNRSKLLRKAYKSTTAIEEQMRIKTNPVRYNLRLLPHGERWMYALDIPAQTAPESFVSDDFQLLSIRKTAMEAKMQLSAYLDYSAGLKLTDKQRRRALAWPAGSNPRLKALGQELKQKGLSAGDLSSDVLGLFSQGGYQLGDAPLSEPTNQSLDHFFFDSRSGDTQQLAGSYVMLMRAAGVPARLVAGYRGGSIIALTDFVIVKQQNAHVWAEIWQTEGGWVRVEAKDAVVAPKVQGDAAADRKPKPKLAEKIVTAKVDNQTVDKIKNTAKRTSTKSTGSGDWLSDWQKSIQKIFSGLQKWVINYNPERQSELLQGKKQERLQIGELLLTGLLLSLSMVACYFLAMTFLTHRKRDSVNNAYEQFCHYFSKRGVEREQWECPRDYGQRLSSQFPDYDGAINTVIKSYIDTRYGQQEKQQFVRQVKRFLAMM